MDEMPVSLKLKALRERSGLTMQFLAKACSFRGASSYQRYEDPALFIREFLPREMLQGVTKAFIGTGDPPITEQEIASLFGLETENRSSVQIVGYVGAGSEAHYYGVGQGEIGEAERPPGATKYTVAVEVRGDSMAGKADHGDLIYYDDMQLPPRTNLIGRLCVVGLPNDKVLVKKLMPGSKRGYFHLYSTNSEPMLDQQVDWAAKVIWIKPR